MPASVGLGLLSAYEVARPAVRESAREGKRWLLLALFLLTLKASLLSPGGLGNVPSLHDDLIARGAVTERQLAALSGHSLPLVCRRY